MRTKIEVEKALKEINSAIIDYIEERIDENELAKRLHSYNNGFEEKLIRYGIFVIPIIFTWIFDRFDILFDKKDEREKGLQEMRKMLKEYYDEVKAGVEPQYSKIQFSYSFKSPEYYVEVKNGKSQNL